MEICKKIKDKIENKKINHTHKKNSDAILQKVLISTNNFGQRDENFTNNDLKNLIEISWFLVTQLHWDGS